MAMTTGTKLEPYHLKGILLDYDKAARYQLWLACGHSGGQERAGQVVRRKRCHSCGGTKTIVRVEPVT